MPPLPRVLLTWFSLAACVSLSAYALLVAGSRLPQIGPVPIAAAIARMNAASVAASLGGFVVAVGLVRSCYREAKKENRKGQA